MKNTFHDIQPRCGWRQMNNHIPAIRFESFQDLLDFKETNR